MTLPQIPLLIKVLSLLILVLFVLLVYVIFRAIVRGLSLLDKYLLSETLLWLFPVYMGFIIVMVGNDFFLMVGWIIEKQIPPAIVMKLLFLRAPIWMALGIPVAVLFSVLLGIGRLANDNEISALRTSGVSLIRMLFPLLFVGIFASYATWYINEKIVPPNLKAYYQLSVQWGASSVMETIKPQRFLSAPKNRYFYFNQVDVENNRAYGVMMLDFEGSLYPRQIVAAKSAVIEENILHLENVREMRFTMDGRLEAISQSLNNSIDVGRDVVQNIRPPENPVTQSFLELTSSCKKKAKAGSPKKDIDICITEKHFKLSLPLVALMMVLVAFPLSARATRGARYLALFYSIFLYGLYYILNSGTKILGYSGIVPAALAGWLTTGTFFLIGLFLLIRGER